MWYVRDPLYWLRVNEFDDLTNTCCPEVDRDRTTTQAASFEEECGCSTALHHETITTDVSTCAVLNARTNHAHKSWRTDVPIILPGWRRLTGGSQSIPTVHPCLVHQEGSG